MGIGIWFWIGMFFLLVCGGIGWHAKESPWVGPAWNILLFLLFFLLGLASFGSPIK